MRTARAFLLFGAEMGFLVLAFWTVVHGVDTPPVMNRQTLADRFPPGVTLFLESPDIKAFFGTPSAQSLWKGLKDNPFGDYVRQTRHWFRFQQELDRARAAAHLPTMEARNEDENAPEPDIEGGDPPPGTGGKGDDPGGDPNPLDELLGTRTAIAIFRVPKVEFLCITERPRFSPFLVKWTERFRKEKVGTHTVYIAETESRDGRMAFCHEDGLLWLSNSPDRLTEALSQDSRTSLAADSAYRSWSTRRDSLWQFSVFSDLSRIRQDRYFRSYWFPVDPATLQDGSWVGLSYRWDDAQLLEQRLYAAEKLPRSLADLPGERTVSFSRVCPPGAFRYDSGVLTGGDSTAISVQLPLAAGYGLPWTTKQWTQSGGGHYWVAAFWLDTIPEIPSMTSQVLFLSVRQPAQVRKLMAAWESARSTGAATGWSDLAVGPGWSARSAGAVLETPIRLTWGMTDSFLILAPTPTALLKVAALTGGGGPSLFDAGKFDLALRMAPEEGADRFTFLDSRGFGSWLAGESPTWTELPGDHYVLHRMGPQNLPTLAKGSAPVDWIAGYGSMRKDGIWEESSVFWME